jgi:hypothetical protein
MRNLLTRSDTITLSQGVANRIEITPRTIIVIQSRNDTNRLETAHQGTTIILGIEVITNKDIVIKITITILSLGVINHQEIRDGTIEEQSHRIVLTTDIKSEAPMGEDNSLIGIRELLVPLVLI